MFLNWMQMTGNRLTEITHIRDIKKQKKTWCDRISAIHSVHWKRKSLSTSAGLHRATCCYSQFLYRGKICHHWWNMKTISMTTIDFIFLNNDVDFQSHSKVQVKFCNYRIECYFIITLVASCPYLTSFMIIWNRSSKRPTPSYSLAPPQTLWDARHDPVQ